MRNLERVKGKAGGKKYAPPLTKSSGWQKVRTHQEKGKRRKQKKKARKIKNKVSKCQRLTEAIKRAKLGGKTKIQSALADQDTFPYPLFQPLSGRLV